MSTKYRKAERYDHVAQCEGGYGHKVLMITEEDIEHMKKGGVLFGTVEEYSFSVKFTSDEEEFWDIENERNKAEGRYRDAQRIQDKVNTARRIENAKKEAAHRAACGCTGCQAQTAWLEQKGGIQSDGFVAGGVQKPYSEVVVDAMAYPTFPVCIKKEKK